MRAHKPDVAIVDIRMPPDNTDDGLRAAATIREELPETGILVLSQYVEEHYAVDLLAAGSEGVGYLLKDRVAEVDRFIDALRRVDDGGSVLDPEVVSQMLGRRRDDSPLETLTDREREVLKAMAEGQTNRAISEELFVANGRSSATSPRSSRSSISQARTAAIAGSSRGSPTCATSRPSETRPAPGSRRRRAGSAGRR